MAALWLETNQWFSLSLSLSLSLSQTHTHRHTYIQTVIIHFICDNPSEKLLILGYDNNIRIVTIIDVISRGPTTIW